VLVSVSYFGSELPKATAADLGIELKDCPECGFMTTYTFQDATITTTGGGGWTTAVVLLFPTFAIEILLILETRKHTSPEDKRLLLDTSMIDRL